MLVDVGPRVDAGAARRPASFDAKKRIADPPPDHTSSSDCLDLGRTWAPRSRRRHRRKHGIIDMPCPRATARRQMPFRTAPMIRRRSAPRTLERVVIAEPGLHRGDEKKRRPSPAPTAITSSARRSLPPAYRDQPATAPVPLRHGRLLWTSLVRARPEPLAVATMCWEPEREAVSPRGLSRR